MRIRHVASPEDWAAARAVRQRVFVEEQACPPEEEWDEHDWPDGSATHLIAEVGGDVIATARWRPVAFRGRAAAKLERFAVFPEHRGRGYGRQMVAAAMEDARRAGYSSFVLHAQAYLEAFYGGFGFVREGGEFVEAGIPHVRMHLEVGTSAGDPAVR
jgi:predicted GNAT family N-acyltransferase